MKKLILSFIAISLACTGLSAQVNSNEAALSYMSYLSSKLVNRPLNTQESNLLRNQGQAAFVQIITSWTDDPSFFESAKQYVELLLSTNGSNSGVNFDLPGYLGFDIARRKRPYRDLITAQSCVNREGQNISCDTGAPFTAGVLTTRAFLKRAQGAYNISRAGKLMKEFLCTTYPLPDSLEPKMNAASMVPEFATTSGAISFGNGNNCYSCHSQFGHHTQFFVKFDLNGNYVANATGLQSVGATDGFSQNNLLVSHYREPARAGQENSQILGRQASNLRQASEVIANSDLFLPCAIKHLMRHFLRLTDQNVASIKPDLFEKITKDAIAINPNPSFSHLLTAIVTNQNVYNSFVKKGALP